MPTAPAPRAWPMRAAAAVPFAILAAAAIYLDAHWSQIPAHFPISWSASGQVTGWSTRSFWGVYGALLLAAVVCVLCALIAWASLHFAPHDSEHARRQQRVCAGILAGVANFLALVFARVALLPLYPAAHQSLWSVVVVPLVVAVMIIFAWRASPPSAHETAAAAAPGAWAGKRDEDRYWVAGLYRNPSDPAVMVEKRYGGGYTVNIGNAAGRRLLAATLALIAIPLLFALVAR